MTSYIYSISSYTYMQYIYQPMLMMMCFLNMVFILYLTKYFTCHWSSQWFSQELLPLLDDKLLNHIILHTMLIVFSHFSSSNLFSPPSSELSLSISLLGLNLEEHCDWLADGREYPSQREPDNFHIYFRGADTSVSNPECHSGWCVPLWLGERKKEEKKSCFIKTSWTAASDASLILKGIGGVKGSVGQISWGSLSRSLLTSSCL